MTSRSATNRTSSRADGYGGIHILTGVALVVVAGKRRKMVGCLLKKESRNTLIVTALPESANPEESWSVNFVRESGNLSCLWTYFSSLIVSVPVSCAQC